MHTLDLSYIFLIVLLRWKHSCYNGGGSRFEWSLPRNYQSPATISWPISDAAIWRSSGSQIDLPCQHNICGHKQDFIWKVDKPLLTSSFYSDLFWFWLYVGLSSCMLVFLVISCCFFCYILVFLLIFWSFWLYFQNSCRFDYVLVILVKVFVSLSSHWTQAANELSRHIELW